MRINHNISSMTNQASLFKTQRSMSKNLEKLSTGLRINRAADDAAGLAVSENLRTQVRGSSQARKNTQDAISMLKIADGAMQEQADILQRMRELVIQAKNDTYTQTERDYMGTEFEALLDELDRIANVTNFNGMQLFANTDTTNNNQAPHSTENMTDAWDNPGDAVMGATDDSAGKHFNMMIGANYSANDIAAYNPIESYDKSAENMLTIQFGQMDVNGLFSTNDIALSFKSVVTLFGNRSAFDYVDVPIQNAVFGSDLQEKLTTIMNLIDGDTPTNGGGLHTSINTLGGYNKTGLERINTQRAYIGATINRLESTVNNLMTSETNQQAAESQIRDVDFAFETAQFTKNQILSQSATSMLAQSNMVPQGVLQLLG